MLTSLCRCQNLVFSAQHAKMVQLKTAHSAGGVFLVGHAMLPAARRGEVRDLIRWRVAMHVPSGKFLTYFSISKFLITFGSLF